MTTIEEVMEGGLDTGEAAIRVELLNGNLRVVHGFTGELLLEGVAHHEFWADLWDHIQENAATINYRKTP